MKNLKNFVFNAVNNGTKRTFNNVRNLLGADAAADAVIEAAKALAQDPSDPIANEVFDAAYRKAMPKQVCCGHKTAANYHNVIVFDGYKTVIEQEPENAISGMDDYNDAEPAIVRFEYAKFGFKEPPKSIKLPDGNIAALYTGSDGDVKKGAANGGSCVYILKSFIEAHPNIFDGKMPYIEYVVNGNLDEALAIRESAEIGFMEARKEERRCYKAFLTAKKGGSVEAKKAAEDAKRKADSAFDAAKAKLDSINKKIKLMHNPAMPEKYTTQKLRQRRMLNMTPSDATNIVLTTGNSHEENGVSYVHTVILKGKKFKSNIRKEEFYKISVSAEGDEIKYDNVEQIDVSCADGQMMLPYDVAIGAGIIADGGAAQCRVEFGAAKAVVKPYHKHELKTNPSAEDGVWRLKDAFGNECWIDSNTAILTTHCCKDTFLYASAEEYIGEGKRIRVCQWSSESGLIKLGRQTMQALSETDKELNLRLVARSAGRCALCDEKEMYEMRALNAAPEINEIGLDALEILKANPALANATTKQIHNEFVNARAGRCLVRGGSFLAAVTNQTFFGAYVYGEELGKHTNLKKGEIIVPRHTGLTIGQEVVLFRYPYINPMLYIAKVAGYNNTIGLVEFGEADGETVTVDLSMDFDGDHIYVVWDEAVVEAAKRTNDKMRRIGVRHTVYAEPEFDEAMKYCDLSHMIARGGEAGNVGRATTPVFMLQNLMPKDAQADTPVNTSDLLDELNEEITAADLGRLLMLTCAMVTWHADAVKHGTAPDISKTHEGEIMSALNKAKPNSEQDAHYMRYWDLKRQDKLETRFLPPDTSRGSVDRIYAKINQLCSAKEGENGKMVFDALEYLSVVDRKDGEGHGWTYQPIRIDWKPIPAVRWQKPIGIEGAENRTMAIGKASAYKADEEFFLGYDNSGNPMFVTGYAALKEYILSTAGVEEETEDMTNDEKILAVSFEPALRDKHLRISLLTSRIYKAMHRKDVLLSDCNRKKRETAQIAYRIGATLCQMWIYRKFGVMATNEQGDIAIYQQVGSYLFADGGSTFSGHEICFFISTYKEWMKEAVLAWRASGYDDKLKDPDSFKKYELAHNCGVLYLEKQKAQEEQKLLARELTYKLSAEQIEALDEMIDAEDLEDELD